MPKHVTDAKLLKAVGYNREAYCEAIAARLLIELAKEWFVELTAFDGGWRLMITKRVGGYCAHVYNDTNLGSVVVRAYNGDEPNFRSR